MAEQPFDVLREDVHLEVDRVAGLLDAERGQREGGGDEADGEVVGGRVDDGQAHSVDRDRALLHDVAGQPVGEGDLDDLPVLGDPALDDAARAVDVPLDDVPAEAAAERHGALQVDPGAGGQRAEAGAVQRLGHDVGGELVVPEVHDGEADAVDGDGVAVFGALGHDGAAQSEAGGVVELLDGGDLTQFFDNSGEHSVSLPSRNGDGGDAQIGADTDGLGHIEAQRLGDGGDSGVGEGCGPAPRRTGAR